MNPVKPQVVIVASAFSVEAIRHDGHAAWLQATVEAGAEGFEVRRELFASDDLASATELARLGEQIDAARLWAVYSTPSNLFDGTGKLDGVSIERGIAESQSLGARIVKFQLGGAPDGSIDTSLSTLSRLIDTARQSHAKLVVENGQLKAGGAIAAFAQLFDALARSDAMHSIGMTFDTGNWLWAQQDPLEAAERLHAHVTYIHCKAVKGEGARRFATAPTPDDTHFRALLGRLPRDVPRGIEFPFDPNHLAADAARHVRHLKQITEIACPQ